MTFHTNNNCSLYLLFLSAASLSCFIMVVSICNPTDPHQSAPCAHKLEKLVRVTSSAPKVKASSSAPEVKASSSAPEVKASSSAPEVKASSSAPEVKYSSFASYFGNCLGKYVGNYFLL